MKVKDEEFFGGMARGATVLGNATGQQFQDVSSITDIDEPNVTTITVRLVAALGYDPIWSASPAPVATPVPPPIPVRT